MIAFFKNHQSELFFIVSIIFIFFANNWIDFDILITAVVSLQLIFAIVKRIRYNQKGQDTIIYFSAKKQFFNTSIANRIIGLFLICVVAGILLYLYATGRNDISWEHLKYIVLAFASGCFYIVTKGDTDYIEVKNKTLDYKITSYKNAFSTINIDAILVSTEKVKFSLKNGENHYVLHQEFDLETKQKIFQFLKSKLKSIHLEVA